MTMHNPAHPGQVLKGLILDELELNVTQAAKLLNMPRAALSEIVNAKRKISPQVAIKIAKVFNSRAGLWLDMQSAYDLWQAEQVYSADDVSVFKPQIA